MLYVRSPQHFGVTFNAHCVQNPALMATKSSILVFFLSLSTEEILFRRLCWLTMFVVNAAGLALTFVNIFQCRPVSATFKDPVPADANCTDIVTLYLSSAPVNIITDLAILFLPMPILTGMRLPRKQKIILVVTFSFGVFVAVVDVVRVAYLQSASTVRLQELGHKGVSSSRVVEQDDFSCKRFARVPVLKTGLKKHQGMHPCPSCGRQSRSMSG